MDKNPSQPTKPLLPANRQKAQIDRSAIKGDYKTWKGSLSHTDLVEWLKTCYNEYTDWGNDLTLPRDTRNSYLDRAVAMKFTLDYIDRQA